MVITDLAKIRIQQLLQDNNAKYLKIALAGNSADGFQTIITFETEPMMEFITITTSPLIVLDPRAYVKFANCLFDFDTQANELKFQF